MRKVRQSPGRSEKLFKREDKGIYLTEYFDRIARRNSYEPVELSARWKDIAYTLISPDQWPVIFSSLYDVWAQSDKAGKNYISYTLGRPASLDVACHAAASLTDPADIITAMKFCAVTNEKSLVALFEKLEKNLLPQVRNISPELMPDVLKAYLNRNIYPPEILLGHLNKSPSDFFARMSADAFYDFVRAQSLLGLKLKGLNDALAEGVDKHAVKLAPQKHEPLIWSLAVIHSLTPSGAVADSARAFYAGTQIPTPNVRNAICRWFDIPLRKENASFKNAPSSPELKLSKIFAAAGGKILPSSDPRTRDFMPPSDLRLSFNGRVFVFEYDGVETHMRKDTQGKYHYNGSTLFNTAMNAKFTPDTLHIRIDSRNYGPLLRLPHDNSVTLAHAILEQGVHLDSGAYTAQIGETSRLTPL